MSLLVMFQTIYITLSGADGFDIMCKYLHEDIQCSLQSKQILVASKLILQERGQPTLDRQYENWWSKCVTVIILVEAEHAEHRVEKS